MHSTKLTSKAGQLSGSTSFGASTNMAIETKIHVVSERFRIANTTNEATKAQRMEKSMAGAKVIHCFTCIKCNSATNEKRASATKTEVFLVIALGVYPSANISYKWHKYRMQEKW